MSESETPSSQALRDAEALITGFPGFVTSFLIAELMREQPKGRFHLLIESRYRSEAERQLGELHRRVPEFEGDVSLHEGDITRPRLGLDEATYVDLVDCIGVVWHLAAIYDLSVPEELAYRVNVGGTMHVLEFCEACEGLLRHNYISTCYVSGERQGTIYEDELDEGQGHHNHYESTKFWAEVEVQRRSSTIPTVIFRPAIVVGHSETGETFKFDGPYFLLQALDRLPDWVPVPNVGKSDSIVNVIPVDFVTAAVAHLGLAAESEGEVFQVADPNPMFARDIVSLALDLMDKPPAMGSVPPAILDRALRNDRLESFVRIPHEAVAYFNHDARYDTANLQRHLADTDIRCPHLSTYLQTLIDFFRLHREDPQIRQSV